MDVWMYVKHAGIPLPGVYFAHEREVFERDGMLMATGPHLSLMDREEPFTTSVRYRTVGDMTCTAAMKSTAADLDAIIDEVSTSRITERGASRADDRTAEAAMEDRKREGYF